MYEPYLRPHVAKMAQNANAFSPPLRCNYGGCGAIVRLVASHELKQWLCPLCGCAKPYVFWEVKSDHDFRYDGHADSLILALAPDACEKCGEGNPPCRCERIRQDEENKRARARYE